MTISYTALLGLAQPVTGTETGQWGTVVNDEITALLEDAVANAASISVTAGNVTLSTTNGSSNQARMSTLIITGTPGTTRNVVAPSQAKIYVVINQSDGAVVIKGAATSGVTIGAGQTAQVAWNGSDFVEIGNYVHGNFVVNGNLSVNGDSTLGNAGADNTTINGQVIAANSNISKTTTLSASAPALAWIKGATYTDTGTAGGTTQALAPFTVFSAPTLSTSNIVTYTNAATVYVAGAPAAAGSATITNPYSLYVAAGDAYFGASVVLNAGTANGVPYLSSPGKVLTTGSALTFDGTSFATTGGINSDNTSTLAKTAGQSLVVGNLAASGAKLDVQTASGTAATFRLFQNGISNFVLSVPANTDALTFLQYGSSELMRLTSTGLGIGTSSPDQKLVVQGGSGTAGMKITDGTYSSFLATISTSGNFGNGSLAGQLYLRGQAGIGFSSNGGGATQMTLDSSGNLGLGVTPSNWNTYTAFQVLGGSVSNYNTDDNTIYASNIYYGGSPSAFRYVKTGQTGTMYRQNTGAHTWHTTGTTTGTANAEASALSQAMTLLANGNLGIGETNPAARLDVRNGVAGEFVAVNALNTLYDAATAASSTIRLGITNSAGVSYATIKAAETSNDDYPSLVFGVQAAVTTNPTERMRINPSGNLGLGVTTPSPWSSGKAVEINTVGNGVWGASQTQTFLTSNVFYNSGFKFGGTGYATALALDGGDFYFYTSNASGSAGGSVTWTNTNTAAMTLNSSGNLGLGVTPSAWSSSWKVMQLGGGTTLSAWATDAGTNLSANAFNDGSWKRINAAAVAQYSLTSTGEHRWNIAGSSTAGSAITFTQAMTLDASGNLGVGQTSISSIASGYTTVAVGSTNGGGVRFYEGSTLRAQAVGNINGLSLEASGATFIGFTTNGTERARITSGGYFKASDSGAYTNATGLFHEFRQTASDQSTIYCTNTSALPYGIRMSYTGAAPNGTDNWFLYCEDSGPTQRAAIRSNGGFANYSANDVNLASDRRLKNTIEPMRSYYDVFKNLSWVTWLYNDQTDDLKNHGVIAQELQALAPEFVCESEAKKTPEGETPYLGIWEQDFKMAGMSVITELIKKIEKLEAEVAALKGA